MTATAKTTGCVCDGPGPCKRHKDADGNPVIKNLTLYRKCRTDETFFRAWEEGRGPRQKSPAEQKSLPQGPSVAKMAWNLAGSLAVFVFDGCRTVTKEQYQERLEICDPCKQRKGNRCAKCGCRLSLKARGRAFKCPLDKWPVTSSQ